MIWYHGTNEKEGILRDGFKQNPQKINRFGNGIYFTDHLTTALQYGQEVVEVELDSKLVLFPDVAQYTIHEWNQVEQQLIRQYGVNYRDYIPTYLQEEHFAHALCVEYADGEKELVVFDLFAIKIPERAVVV